MVKTMNTTDIANKLVEYCKKGQWELAQTELYSDDAVSIEPKGANFPELVSGLKAIIAKGAQWESMVEQFHGLEIEGPLVASNHFSVTMKMDITMKGAPRMQNDEIGVFKVKNGKIVSEQFFYPVK